MLVRAFEIEVGREPRVCDASRRRRARPSRAAPSDASMPESNQTSSVSVHLLVVRRVVAEQLLGGRCAATPRCRPARPRCATCSSSASVRGCSSPVSLCTKNGIGTPHCRWRDSVQSGRLAIMPCRRALPQLGKNCVASMPRSAVARSVSGGFVAVEARHVVHAGEPLRRRAVDHRRLVAPAMHVAVRELLGVRAARRASRSVVDDRRVRLPDLHGRRRAAGSRRSGRRPAPGSGSRRPSCRSGGTTEVLDAVGRRGVDDAGAGSSVT